MVLMTQVCLTLHPLSTMTVRALSPHSGSRPRLESGLCYPQCSAISLRFLTDKRAFFIICTSELGPPQIYELVALTSSDKNT